MAEIEYPKLSQTQAHFVRDSGLLTIVRAARAKLRDSPSPVEFIPDEVQTRMPAGVLAAGDEFEQRGKYVEASLSQEQINSGRKAIENAHSDIEEILDSIEKTTSKPDCAVQLMFALAVLLILCWISVILWGVLFGSRIGIAGKDGLAAIMLASGFGWAATLMRRTWNLKC